MSLENVLWGISLLTWFFGITEAYVVDLVMKHEPKGTKINK
jgi:hypothetical protein